MYGDPKVYTKVEKLINFIQLESISNDQQVFQVVCRRLDPLGQGYLKNERFN